jgi:hypothetical protein
MEVPQGTSPSKHVIFFFFFSYTKSEVRTGPDGGMLVPVEGKEVGKGCSRVNMVQILHTHSVNGKMRSVETIPGMWGEGDKGGWWKGEFNYDIFDTL